MSRYPSRKYVIITIEDVEDVDFDQVLQSNSKTLRFSEDGEYTFVKFEGDTPSFLEGKTQYTHSEFLEILKDTSGIWCVEEDEEIAMMAKLKNVVNNISWDKYNPFNWFS